RLSYIGIKEIELLKILNSKDVLALASIGFMVWAIALKFPFGNGAHFIAALSELRRYDPFVPLSNNLDGRSKFETALLSSFKNRTHGCPLYVPDRYISIRYISVQHPGLTYLTYIPPGDISARCRRCRFGDTAANGAGTNGFRGKGTRNQRFARTAKVRIGIGRDNRRCHLLTSDVESDLDCPQTFSSMVHTQSALVARMVCSTGFEPAILGLPNPALSVELRAHRVVGFGLRRPAGVTTTRGMVAIPTM